MPEFTKSKINLLEKKAQREPLLLWLKERKKDFVPIPNCNENNFGVAALQRWQQDV